MKAIRSAITTLATATLALFGGATKAADRTWLGGTNHYHLAYQWDPAGKPNLAPGGDTALVSGADSFTVYDAALAGGDMMLNGPFTLDDGARWAQTNGIAWIQANAASGVLTVKNGAEFDTGTTGQTSFQNGATLRLQSGGRLVSRSPVIINNGGKVSIEGGAWTAAQGNVTLASAAGNCVMSAGSITAGEFQIHGVLDMSGGTLDIAFLQMEQTAAGTAAPRINLSGGEIILSPTHNGMYNLAVNPQNGAINFTTKSSGGVTFENCNAATARTRYITAAKPLIRYNEEAIPAADIDATFDFTQDGADVRVSLKQADAGAASFDEPVAVSNVSVSPAAATLSTAIASAGSPAADVYAYWGEAPGGAQAGGWEHSALIGAAQDGDAVVFSAFDPPLEPNKSYYARIAAQNADSTVWALPASLYFITAPVAITASAASVPQNMLTPITLTVSRPAAADCVKDALTVAFALSGTAVRGTHYTLSPEGATVTIPAGQASATLSLTPIADWANMPETEFVITLLPRNYATNGNSSASVAFLAPSVPDAPVNAFIGAVSDRASAAANWSLGVTPDQTHDVVFSGEYTTRGTLVWDLPGAVVNSLSQPFGADKLLMFETTAAQPLTITGDATLGAGRWTHAGPAAAPAHALNLAIGGDLTVAAGTAITAGTGEANSDSGKPRGWHQAGPGYAYGYGASHGGEGAGSSAPTYGSVLDPVSYGSSGHGDNDGYSGGGVIILDVAGAMVLDGRILSNGFGYDNVVVSQGASSGGSINITAASLSGSGNIAADGGVDNNYGGGSGGRVRVRLTGEGADFAGFMPRITAHGANDANSAGMDRGGAAAGTVALQTAADAEGSARVLVSQPARRAPTNALSRASATHLPPMLGPAEDLTYTTWQVEGGARLRLTRNTRIAALEINKTASVSPGVHLEGFVLRVDSFTCNGVTYENGVFTSATHPGFLFGEGEVRIPVRNTTIIIR